MACKLFPIAVALALAACGAGPERIDVSGTPGDLRFTVIPAEDGSRSCVKDLSVTPVIPEDADPTWQVSTVDPDKCLHMFRYGELTADLAQRVAATPLRPGVKYRVRMSGGGFSLVRDFHLTARGVTVQD